MKRSMDRDGEHTHKIDFLGQFDFPSSNNSYWKNSSQRKEVETERGRDSETGGRFSSFGEYFAERLRRGCAKAFRGNLILLERS